MRTLAAAAASVMLAVGLAAPAHADVFIMCPGGYSGVASSVTSCGFADNVHVAWLSQPGNVVVAYSPATGRSYVMSCDPYTSITFFNSSRVLSGVECYGGNDARVVFGW